MKAIVVECLSALEILDRTRPVYYADDPTIDSLLLDPSPAFVVGASGDSFDPVFVSRVAQTDHTLVAVSKKEATVLRKLGVDAGVPDMSARAIVERVTESVGPLSRRALAISNLKGQHEQVMAAIQIAMLGDAAMGTVLGQFPDGAGFVLQESFLDMRIGLCMDLVDSMPATRVVELGMLLLSGHTLAFALKGADARSVMALGYNPYYVNKVRDRSVMYTRKVDFHRATSGLTSILPRIKRGHNPHRLLKSTILEILSSA